jgi:CRP-like cAMP-binding protein
MVMTQTARLYDLITSLGHKSTLDKGEVFQSTETGLEMSVIKKGYIKRYSIRNDGSLSIQSIYGPGHFFPLTIAYKVLLGQELYQGPETLHYETMTRATIYSLDSAILKEHVDADPSLYRDLFFVSGRRLHSNIQRLENNSLLLYYNQVAHQLLYFARTFGISKGTGVLIDLPLTQQDIADNLSTTRETASLSLRDLKKKGIIKTAPGKHIFIPSMEKLEAEAYA